MSKSQGLSTKDSKLGILLYRQSYVFLGQLGIFLGGFPFYSGPMLSYVPKAKGCRQKDSKLGILLCRQSWVFLGQLGILG